MTNAEAMANLLLDMIEDHKDFERMPYDDSGASEEAFIYYDVKCPYCYGEGLCYEDKQAYEMNERKTCVMCKYKWLMSEVE